MAYSASIKKIRLFGVVPGTRGDYTYENVILCGEFPIPVHGFSTSAEFWEIFSFNGKLI